MRIFYFLSEFIKQTFGDVAAYPLLNSEQEIENGRLLCFRLAVLKTDVFRLLDRFYEEHKRFVETGSFEIVWDDEIFDTNEQ